MVKGLSRKVIIVKSPDPKMFEQAIFIVRDDYLVSQGISQKELMRQAKQAANGYVVETYGAGRTSFIKPILYGIAILITVGLIGTALSLFL